ncbi:MAG: hypothetical protein U0165_05060 [Polyangiaceae bacterium]
MGWLTHRRSTLIALVSASGATALGTSLSACGSTDPKHPGTAQDHADTVVIDSTPNASSSSRPKPIGTASATVRPRPDATATAAAQAEPTYNRCYSRGPSESECAELGSSQLAVHFGTSATRITAGPYEPPNPNASPTPYVRCCYFDPGYAVKKGRPLTVGLFDRVASIQGSRDWS